MPVAFALHHVGWTPTFAGLAVVGVLAHVGLGPFGPITPPVGIVLALALFAAQVAASHWWLTRFRFGPVEWLWRALGSPKRLLPRYVRCMAILPGQVFAAMLQRFRTPQH